LKEARRNAELSLFAIGALVNFVLDQIGEEPLREVLRIGRRRAAPTGESVERRPVSLAELGQRRPRHLRIRLRFTGSDDHAPVRGPENIGRAVEGAGQGLHD